MLELYNPLDKMVLANKLSPGVVVLTGHDRERNWDVKQSKNADGGTSSLNGKPVGGFTATYMLANEEELAAWEDWQALCDSLAPDTSGKPQRASVYHPDLARQRFTEVSVKKVYGIVHDGKGGYIGKVDFIEYSPPKPKNPSTSSKLLPQPDPLAALKSTRDALLKEAQTP